MEDEEEDEEADEERRTRWQHSRAKTGGHWRENQANKRHHHWTLDASSQLRAKTWPTATASRTHARLHKEDTSWPACARTNHAVTPSPGKSSRRNSRPLEPVLENLLLNLVLEVGTFRAPHAGVALCASCVPAHSRTLSNFPNMVEDKCRCIACIFADCPLVPWPSFAWPAFPRSSGPAPQ